MKTRLILTACASALLLGLPAAAFADSAPPATAAAAAQGGVAVPPLGFTKRVLANGMEIYTARDASTSNVTVQVWYRVGSKDDPAGRSGFAHLFEHLLFKATKNMPSETFDRLTEDVGGMNNAFTADDVTAYYEVVPANHLQRILFAEADRMGSLVVDEPTFVSERDVVKEEYRQRILASPYGRLFGLFTPETIYQDHPYRRPGIGSIEELNASTLDDVLRFHATYYRPDNAMLIVAGNFDQAQLDAWVNEYFAPLKRPATPMPVNDVKEPEPTGPRTATYYAPNVPLPAVVLAWNTVAYRDADRAALTVLDGVLSTGESSRLYRSLVYDKQIAASIGSNPDFAQQAGNLTAYAIMADGQTVDTGKAALEVEIARLRDAPITAAELSEAKNELVANALRGRESIDDRATTLGMALIMTGDATAADREIAEIQAVTAADVQRVARRYLTPQRQITINYLPADEAHPASVQKMNVDAPVTVAELAPAGPVAVLLPEAERARLPQPGAEVAPATPAVADFRLDNGLRVLVAPTQGLPLVSARLNLNAGSANDPAGKPGVASMTAALLTQGTTTKSAPEIATAIEQLGASIGAGSGADFTNVYANAPKDVFGQTLTLMADLVRNPTFAAEELERQQSQTLDGLRVALSQPGSIAAQSVGRVIYGAAPYGAPGSGTLTSIPALTREDMAVFHSDRFRPSQATLVFSGDVTPAEARALADEAFGDWRDAGPAPAAVDKAGQALTPRVVVIDQPGAGQAAVIAAIRGVKRTDADYFPLTLGNTLLGGGFSSRLNQEIRIKRGLSYGARSSVGAQQDVGVFTASTQTKNETATEVADLILAEVGKLGTSPATEAELAPRRAALIGGFGRSLETVDGLGGLVANLALYDLPMSDLADYAGRVRAVTPQQVEGAFAGHLPTDQASLVIVGDASKFIDALRAKYPNVEVIPLIDLNLDSATLR
ncbi:pitrilysin family protein [uncultured Brevundimonas sp.]|uniref:M16 family metallopeptidase n=2 Tax=uncultured Brevundimonas sp. TaxID=213418 RepID=UPI002628F8B2|nr:pitrilysin family protein [uncultured Brevundimonas sp.]